jgi:hypothetical protein
MKAKFTAAHLTSLDKVLSKNGGTKEIHEHLGRYGIFLDFNKENKLCIKAAVTLTQEQLDLAMGELVMLLG